MSQTLEALAAACLRARVQPRVPEPKVLYEDPTLGFWILAHVYNEGDVHSPRRDGPTRLIRIEGTNMDKVRRLAYENA